MPSFLRGLSLPHPIPNQPIILIVGNLILHTKISQIIYNNLNTVCICFVVDNIYVCLYMYVCVCIYLKTCIFSCPLHISSTLNFIFELAIISTCKTVVTIRGGGWWKQLNRPSFSVIIYLFNSIYCSFILYLVNCFSNLFNFYHFCLFPGFGADIFFFSFWDLWDFLFLITFLAIKLPWMTVTQNIKHKVMKIRSQFQL